MNKVEPIKDMEDVKRILDYLNKKNQRDYLLALFGFYSGLRISDILPLKVSDLLNKTHVKVIEEKREHKREVVIPRKLRVIANEFLKDKQPNEFVFQSRQGYNKHICTTQAYRVIKEAAIAVGIRSNVGTHSLRKTFAYHLYKNTKDIVYVQETLGHSDIATTKRYLGIDLDEIEKAIEKLGFL